MRDTIEAGRILIDGSTLLPDSRRPPGEAHSSGWISVGKLDRLELEASLHKAGWSFFYMAGEIRATVFGFNEQATVRMAATRLIANVKAQNLNCLEIDRVAMSSFLGVPYASVAGHARHIQEGSVLSQATTPPGEAGSLPAADSKIRRQRGEIADEPLVVETAVAAWEDEGGAPGHPGDRLAA